MSRKKKIGFGARVAAVLLVLALIIPMAFPDGVLKFASSALGIEGSSEDGVLLQLSTDEILNTVSRIAGPQVADQLKSDTSGEQPNLADVVGDSLVTTQIVVAVDEAVTAKDKDSNEVSINEELPQAQTQSYYLDKEMEQFISHIHVPENSKLVEQDFVAGLQGLWFIKAYDGEGYQAAAMLDPETMQVQVSFINNSADQKAFTLKVVDATGASVEVTEVSAMIKKAAAQTLTAEELAKYRSQGASVEVRGALAEPAATAPPSESKEEESDPSLGYSGEEIEIAIFSAAAEQVEGDVVDALAIEEEDGGQDADTPAVEEQADETGEEESELPGESSEQVDVDTDDVLVEEEEIETGVDASSTEAGKLIEVEAVVIESEELATKADATTSPGFTVPGNSVFIGLFGGITPFGVNYTVEFYIESTLYKEPVKVAAGSTINKEPAPPQSAWPANTTTFNGWFLDGVDTPFDFDQPITEDVRLYAKFNNAYIITYKNFSGQVIETKAIAPNAPIPEPTVEVEDIPDGKRLVHWYVEGDTPTNAFVFGTVATEDLALRPYSSNSFYVIFISEGDQRDPQSVVSGQKANKPEDPTRLGYNFAHWSTVRDGSAYSFDTPVSGNLTLYAVWTPNPVKYTVVYWVEKPNIVGDPALNLNNYRYAHSKELVAPAGSTVTLSQSDADSDAKVVAERASVTSVNPLRFSNFYHSDTVRIAGNGSTVLNVYYKRVVYTWKFLVPSAYVGNNPKTFLEEGFAGGIRHDAVASPASTYEMNAKFEQDLTSLWPVTTRGNGISYYFQGWQPDAEIQAHKPSSTTTWITKRYNVTYDMISRNNPRTVTTYALTSNWDPSGRDVTVQYWKESLNGQVSGSEYYNSNGHPGAWHLVDNSITQYITISTNSTMLPKKLEGFKVEDEWKVGTEAQGATIKFYYYRLRKGITFITNGGDEIPKVPEQIMYEAPVKAYKPADPVRRGYTFKGWFTDENLTMPFDFNTGIMDNKDGLLLYAKWEASTYTVTYYDRLGSNKIVVETQGYGPGDYVTYPTNPDYQPGAVVEDYGQFLGWKWIVPDTTIFTEFSTEIPIHKNIELYATWKTSGFTVKYVAGDGTGTPPQDDEVYDIGRHVGVKSGEGLTANKPGYVFYGWKPGTSGIDQLYYPRNLYAILGDTLFTAVYGPKDNTFNVTFNAGYTGATQASLAWTVQKNTSIYLLEDDYFTRPNATQIGWSETPGSTVAQYGLNELVQISRNTNLYAVWSLKSFNVYFHTDTDKGALSYKGIVQPSGEHVFRNVAHGTTWAAAIDEVPVVSDSAGWYFTGWKPVLPAGTSTITSDMTFVAQFKQKSNIVLTAGSATKEFDGEYLTNGNIHTTYLDTSLYKVEGTMTAASKIRNAGTTTNNIDTYQIIRLSDNANVTNEFAVTINGGSLKVTQRPASIVAENKSKIYGTADPSLTVVKTGEIASEPFQYTVKRENGETVGSYKIEVTLTSNPNYTISTGNALFTITKSSGVMNASAQDVTVTYDGNAHGIAVNVTGASGYTVQYATTSGGTYSTAQPSKINVADGGVIYYKVTHPNYADVTGSATVTIAPAKVTVKANSKTIEYGKPLPAFDATVTGKPTNGVAVNYSVTCATDGSVGSHPIVVGLNSNPNYTVTPQDGTLTIDKRKGVMTAAAEKENVVATYDAQKHEINVIVGGISDSLYTIKYSDTLNGTYTATQPSKINVADTGDIYFIVEHPHYETIKGQGRVTIQKRPVTVTAVNASKAYRDADPALVATAVGGPVGSDTLDYTVMRTAGEAVGNYPITVTPGVNPNYELTPVGGTFRITQKTGVMTAKAKNDGITVTYDGMAYGIEVVVSGITETNYTITYSTTETGTYSTTQPVKKNVADSGRIYFKVTHPGYDTVIGYGTVTILPRDVTVTANNKSKVYNTADPTFDAAIYNAPVGGDTLNYTVVRDPGNDVGSYPIRVTQSGNPNYNVTTVDGIFTITKDGTGMSASAENDNVVVDYDGEAHGINVIVTCPDNNYTILYADSENGTYTPAQPVKINVSDSGKIYYKVEHLNYAEVKGFATVTINKRPVTVTANGKTKVYGNTDPSLDAAVTNKPVSVNADTINYTLARDSGENAGSYAIRVTEGGNPNYTLTTVNGTLTITKKSGTLTAKAEKDNVVVVYDGETHGINVVVTSPDNLYTVKYSASPGGFFSTTQPSRVTVANSAPIYFEVTHPNYETVTGSANVTITQRPVTVTADDKTMTYGGGEPALTATVSNMPTSPSADLVNYLLARDPGSDVGTYAIKVAVGSNPNYVVTGKNGTLTIAKQGGLMTAEAQEKNVVVVYDGLSHGITVNVTCPDNLYTVKYSETAGGIFSTTQPSKVTVAESGTIYFEVTHPNYDTITGSATVTITKRPAVVTAVNSSKVYGEADPAFTATVSNAAPSGDAVQYTLTRDSGENAGTYAIKVIGGANPNYQVELKNGSFTISKKGGAMSARAREDDVKVTYDGQAHGITVDVTSPDNLYTVGYSTSSTGPFTATQPNKVTVADSGIVYFEVTHPNYMTITGSGRVTIEKRNVTVQAESVGKPVTGSLIEVTVGANAVAGGHGLVSGHTVVAEAKGSGTAGGTYPIVINTVAIMNGGADVSANYNITRQDGSLTINKISITIQLRTTSKTAGDPDPLPGIVLRLGTLLSGDTLDSLPLTYGRTPGETVGNYPTWYTYTGDIYNVTIVRGALTIKPGRVTR